MDPSQGSERDQTVIFAGSQAGPLNMVTIWLPSRGDGCQQERLRAEASTGARLAAPPLATGRPSEILAEGRNDTLVECAGTVAGAWFAPPATHHGHELIAAGSC